MNTGLRLGREIRVGHLFIYLFYLFICLSPMFAHLLSSEMTRVLTARFATISRMKSMCPFHSCAVVDRSTYEAMTTLVDPLRCHCRWGYRLSLVTCGVIRTGTRFTGRAQRSFLSVCSSLKASICRTAVRCRTVPCRRLSRPQLIPIS